MKTLLIVSSGTCVWDDFEKVRSLLSDYDVMAVNDMIPYWPSHVKYGVSLHHDILKTFADRRSYRKTKNRPKLIAPKEYDGIDCVVRFPSGQIQSSGMYAAALGVHFDYDKIIITGCPFDDSGHFYDREPTDRDEYGSSLEKWSTLRKRSLNRVRAVSGTLVECFGELTKEWLIKE